MDHMHATADYAPTSLWITANAGSGKTTALTDRVVGLLLRGVEPERICCLTYTKAAAGEMRHRVLERLRDLLLLPHEDARAMIVRLLGHSADAAQLAQARGLFGRVLDSPRGGVQFTTIHGFCQQVLTLFPLEAGVAPHFTVLEEAAAERVLAQARHRLLAAGEDADAALVEALALIGERSGEVTFDRVVADIAKRRAAWAEIWQNQTPPLLRGRLWQAHGLAEAATDAGLLAQLMDCMRAEESAILRAHLPQLMAHKTKREQKVGVTIADWLETPAEARLPKLEAFIALFLTQKHERRKDSIGDKEFPIGTPLRDAVEAIAARVYVLVQQRLALACAEESFAVAIIARAFLDLYAQAKDAARALDYDDLIVKTRELFAQPAMLGWVMSKLDYRIDHLLVDEAQDTSAEQWPMVDALVGELIAANEGIGSGGVARSLLVVGDEKQSIYSFQGAAPELFAAKQAVFQDMLAHSAAPLATRLLDVSYRSGAAVLEVVNHIAQAREVAGALTASGESPPHRLHRTGAAGMVALYPPITRPEKENFPPLTLPRDYLVTRSAAQLLADDVATRVAAWLAQERVVETTGKPITPGDIVILVHRRAPLVLPLIRALQRRNVPVAGMDRLTLSTHLAVRDLLALMAWCVNPADDLALAQVLRSPIVGITDDALRGLAHGRTGSLWAAVGAVDDAIPPPQPSPVNGGGSQNLSHWLTMAHAAPYDFLTDVLEVRGCRRAFATRFGAEVHEVLDELKAQAAAMPADALPSLAHFVEWISGSTRQIKREQESGAGHQVRIMTVHGAKGLEAPVVLMVDTVSVPNTGKEVMFTTRDANAQMLPAFALSDTAKHAARLTQAKEEKAAAIAAEYQRLLYVALTRARDELHVFGIAEKTGKVKADSWYAHVAASMQALGAREQEGVRVWGGVTSPAGGSAAVASENMRKNLALPAWATTRAPGVSRAVAASPSARDAHEISPYVRGVARGAKERGVRIHRVLELLRAESDAAEIVRLIAHLAPDWSEQQQAQAAAEITALHATHRWLWAHPSRPEVGVCGTVDGAVMQGQIDRLVETPEAVVIVDYKTGRQVPARAAEVPESYVLQLKTYRALVAPLYPNIPIRCAILWTHAPSLMWLDEGEVG